MRCAFNSTVNSALLSLALPDAKGTEPYKKETEREREPTNNSGAIDIYQNVKTLITEWGPTVVGVY